MTKKKSMSKDELMKYSRQSYISLAVFFLVLIALVLFMYFFAQSRQKGKTEKSAELSSSQMSKESGEDSAVKNSQTESSESTESTTSKESTTSTESGAGTESTASPESKKVTEGNTSASETDGKKEVKEVAESKSVSESAESSKEESSGKEEKTKSSKELKEEAEREKVYKSHLTLTKQVGEDELMKLLESKNGGKSIVYVGRATCPDCYKFVPILDEALREVKKDMYYFDCEHMSDKIRDYLINLGLEFIPSLLKVENDQITISKISEKNNKDDIVKLINDFLD